MVWVRWAWMVVILLTMTGCGGSTDLKVDAHLKTVTTSHVGGDDGFSMTIQNQDADIGDLVVFLADGHDNWLDHHVVLNSGSCTIDKTLTALRCGPLKAGQTMDIVVLSSPKDAGNFDYGFGVGDDAGQDLRQWKYQETYSEAVTQG